MTQVSFSDVDELTKKILPLTVLRRRAGEVFAKLEELGEMLITKDGKPVAKLSSLKEDKSKKTDLADDIRKIHNLSGGFHLGKITSRQINRIMERSYENLLSR